MRFPRSSSGCGESCGASVLVGVVGHMVLPAAPDDAGPGAGEDAYGVRVSFAAGGGLVVDVFGPGAGVAGGVGEVDEGVGSFLSAVQRNPTLVILPLARVTGATPARAARA